MNALADHTTEFAARVAERRAEAGSLRTYADPHPGMKGADQVWQPCARACTNGYYMAPSSMSWEAVTVDGEHKSGTLCFGCNGDGGYYVKVSSVRARVRRQVTEHNAHVRAHLDAAEDVVRREMADEQHEADERAAAEARRSEAEAALEGLPEAGEKLADITATVEFFTTFETEGFGYYSGMETKAVLKMVDARGRIYVWVTGSMKAFDLGRVGTVVTIRKATVKCSRVYRDEAQVELSRPTLVEN